jgi:WhiB family redox-sensing transcriptional regulator
MNTRAFFPAPGDTLSPAMARDYCQSCPVQRECLAFALDVGPELRGIWGGTSQREPRRLRARTRLTSSP